MPSGLWGCDAVKIGGSGVGDFQLGRFIAFHVLVGLNGRCLASSRAGVDGEKGGATTANPRPRPAGAYTLQYHGGNRELTESQANLLIFLSNRLPCRPFFWGGRKPPYAWPEVLNPEGTPAVD